jgi:hypothetical protein
MKVDGNLPISRKTASDFILSIGNPASRNLSTGYIGKNIVRQLQKYLLNEREEIAQICINRRVVE